jgi:transcriptional regulator with XRE-family HTH domain
MIDEAEIGRKIKRLRLDRGLNLQDVADATGFTKGYLSRVENSKKAPPVSTLIIIAKALGTNISAIFSEEADYHTSKKVRTYNDGPEWDRVRLLVRAAGSPIPTKAHGSLHLDRSCAVQA